MLISSLPLYGLFGVLGDGMYSLNKVKKQLIFRKHLEQELTLNSFTSIGK